MTKAMPFLQKAILLSYDPRRFVGGLLLCLPCRYCFPFIVKTDDKIPLFCYTYTK